MPIAMSFGRPDSLYFVSMKIGRKIIFGHADCFVNVFYATNQTEVGRFGNVISQPSKMSSHRVSPSRASGADPSQLSFGLATGGCKRGDNVADWNESRAQ
jgi:hypothetical protein